MYRQGAAAVIEDIAAAEAEFVPVTAVSAKPVAIMPNPAGSMRVVRGHALACADDPDLFFAESPDDVELAKSLCSDCPVRAQCLTGAIARREPWGVWGGELFLRGEIVPRKRARGRPRKNP